MPPQALDPTATIPPAEWDALVNLYETPGPAFLERADRLLREQHGTDRLAVLVVDRLTQLGLGDAARSLVPARSVGAVTSDELRAAVADVPAGLVDRDTLLANLDANLDAVRRRQPSGLAPRLDVRSLRAALERHRIHRTLDGDLHLGAADARGGPPDSDGLPIGASPWHEGFRRPFTIAAEELPLHDAPPVLLIGLGLADAAERVADLTAAAQQGRRPLYLLETDTGALAAWLAAADRRALLTQPRVILCGGPDAIDAYRALLAAHDDLPPAGLYLTKPGSAIRWSELDDIRTAIERERADRFEVLTTDRRGPHARDHRPDAVALAGRLRDGARILGFTSRFTTMLRYSMRDLARAATDLGHDFRVINEADDFRPFTSLAVARTIAEHEPDLVVLMNHFRHEQAGAFGDVPLLTWIQDPADVVLSSATGAALGPLDFVCGYYRNRCVDEFGYPRERFFTTTLPVCHHTFHDAALSPAEATRYDADLMYVGHLHETAEGHQRSWRAQLAPRLHAVLDEIDAEVRAHLDRGEHLPSWRAVVDALTRAGGIAIDERGLEAIANSYAGRQFDLRWRRQSLHWAARDAADNDRRFRLYGDGWDADPILAPYAVGPVEHGEPLRRAYRGARLVLQTIPGGFMHQRSFEGLASGSLVVSRYGAASCAERTFPDVAAVSFTDERSFRSLVDGLLRDNARRDALRDVFRRIVLDELTYTAVFRSVLDRMRAHLLTSPDIAPTGAAP